MFDRFGTNYEAAARGAAGAGAAGGAGGPWQGAPGGFHTENIDLGDLFGDQAGGGGFADLFKQFSRGGRRQTQPSARGRDLTHEITVPFQTAVTGGSVQLRVQRDAAQANSTETITVKIPAGIEDGKKIRLRQQGEASATRGKPGDILIAVHIATHPYFERNGTNLEVNLPLTLEEAVTGARVDCPTPTGTITLTIPPGTSSGKRLRIKGHGIAPEKGPAGDLFAIVQIVLPELIPSHAMDTIRELKLGPTNPRTKLIW